MTALDADADLDDFAAGLFLIISRLLSVANDLELVWERPAEFGHVMRLWVRSEGETAAVPSFLRVSQWTQEASAAVGPGARLSIRTPIVTGLEDAYDLIALTLARAVDHPLSRAQAASARKVGATRPRFRPSPPIDAAEIVAADPRFSSLLGPHPDLRSLVAAATSAHWDDVKETLEEVRRRRAELPETLEAEACSVLAAQLGPRRSHRVEPLARRFGIFGREPETLEEVGRAAGVTRERIRQLSEFVTFPSQKLLAPAADAVVEILERMLPCDPDELADALKAARVTWVDSWRASSLTAALAMTGRTVDLIEVGGLIARPTDAPIIRKVLPAAGAAVSPAGTATVADVVTRLRDGGDSGLSMAVAMSALRRLPEVHWINEERFWIDHAVGRNRLVNVVQRMLVVVSPQTVGDLHGGVSRYFRWRSASRSPGSPEIRIPTVEELEQFVRSHPIFAVASDGYVRSVRPIEMTDLGVEKLTMIGVFRSQPGGLIDRNRLVAACRDAGMRTATVTTFLTFSECFQSRGHNVWGLRGQPATPEAIARTKVLSKAAAASEDRQRLNGVTTSGKPWVATKLTSTILFSGVMSSRWVPIDIRNDLEAIDVGDGERVGTLRFSGTFTYGLQPVMRKYQARVGDVLRIVAEPDQGVSHLEIGGDDLLTEPFGL